MGSADYTRLLGARRDRFGLELRPFGLELARGELLLVLANEVERALGIARQTLASLKQQQTLTR